MRNGSNFLLAVISLLQLCFGCTVDYYLTSSGRECVNVNGEVNTSCTSLGELLSQVNRSDGTQCRTQLFFSPGEYSLSESNLTVNYSITMNGSAEGMVTITCLDSSQDLGSRNRTGTEILFQTVNPRDTNEPNGTVELSGITFQNCINSLKFIYLERVTIRNCTFRYTY